MKKIKIYGNISLNKAIVEAVLKLRWEIFFLVLILAAAFSLRIYKLGKNELWLDEAYCALTAKKGPVGIVQNLRQDNGPPLYYFLLYLWMKVAGDYEIALKALSVCFGVATVLLVYYLGRKNFTPKIGLWAALILAINPLHIYYSQETRMYAPLVFFTLLFLNYLLRLLVDDKASYWAGFIISGVLAIYTSYAGFFFLPLALFFFIFRQKRRRPVRATHTGRPYGRQMKMLISLLIIGASFLPWVPIFLSQPSAQATAWIKHYWVKGKWSSIPGSLEVVFLGANYPWYLKTLPEAVPAPVRIAAVVPAGLIFFLAILPWRKERMGRGPWRKILSLLLTALFLPLVLPFLLSFHRPMYVVGRYDLMVAPVAALILGAGIVKLRLPWAVILTSYVALFTITFTLFGNYYKGPPGVFEKAAALYILQNSKPDDSIVFTGYRRATLEYYLRLFGRDARMGGKLRYYSFPPSVAEHLGWYDVDGFLATKEKLKKEARTLARRLTEETSPGDKVWIAQAKHRVIRLGIDFYFLIEMEGLAREGEFQEHLVLMHPELGLKYFERRQRP